MKKIKKSPDVCSGQRHCMKHSALIAVLSLHRICGRASHQVVFSDDKTGFPAKFICTRINTALDAANFSFARCVRRDGCSFVECSMRCPWPHATKVVVPPWNCTLRWRATNCDYLGGSRCAIFPPQIHGGLNGECRLGPGSRVDLTRRPRHIRRPITIRPVLGKPTQDIFQTTNSDIGARLQRAELLPVIESTRRDSRQRDLFDLTVPTGDREQCVYG